MVLRVTGKDAARVQHILRTGTLVFNFYRYRWEGFEAESGELADVLAQFPDADATRKFAADVCDVILFTCAKSAPAPGQALLPSDALEIRRKDAEQRRLFRSRDFWKELMAVTQAARLQYAGYSYARQADVFEFALTSEQAAALALAAEKLAPPSMRIFAGKIASASRIVLLCSRR